MKTLEEIIIKTPDPRLRQRWPEADLERSQKTLRSMLWLSRRGGAARSLAGLSSIQVLKPGRVVTVQTPVRDKAGEIIGRKWVGFIDPVIIQRSYQFVVGLEGCFSLPQDLRVWVNRPVAIDIQHRESTNGYDHMTTTLFGSAARFAMHEIDHINGILITDYIGGRQFGLGD